KQSTDAASPIAAATRGNTNVRAMATMKRAVPMSSIESKEPVSHPPLNSVPSSPLVTSYDKEAHRRKLPAWHPCRMSGFFKLKVPPPTPILASSTVPYKITSVIRHYAKVPASPPKGVYAPSIWRHDTNVIHQRAIGQWRTIALDPCVAGPAF